MRVAGSQLVEMGRDPEGEPDRRTPAFMRYN